MKAVTQRLQYHFTYGQQYQWLIIASILDFMITFVILNLGGLEVNPSALAVIKFGGFPMLICYKFALLGIIISICEGIYRHDKEKSDMLVRLAIMVSAVDRLGSHHPISPRMLAFSTCLWQTFQS